MTGRAWVAPDWIPVWLQLPRHRKVARTAMAAGVSANEVIGWLVRLWMYAAEFAPDGDLRLSDAELAALVDCPARRRDLAVAALIDGGWLTEDRRLHDWDDWSGAHIRRMVAERERVGRYRRRSAEGTRTLAEPTMLEGSTVERSTVERSRDTPATAPALTRDWSTGDGRAIWDAFDAALGPASTAGERGRRGAAVRDLVQAGIGCDAVRRAIVAWPRVFPDAVMTETAIASHVSRLETGAKARGSRSVASIVAAVTEAASL